MHLWALHVGGGVLRFQGLREKRAVLGAIALGILALWLGRGDALGGQGKRRRKRPTREGSRRRGRRLSPVVFPAPKFALHFSHKTHMEAGRLTCRSCHQAQWGSSRSADVSLVKKKSCLACHPEAKVPKGFGAKGNRDISRCKKCHSQFYRNGFPQKTVYPKPRVRFSHVLHRRKGVGCDECHGGVRKSTALGALHYPKMATCRACHQKRSASVRCTSCHRRKSAKRVRTHYPEGKLVPSRTLGVLDHTVRFKQKHAVAARSHRKDCRACHADSTCLRCHGGTKRVMSIHPANYRLRHASDARGKRQRCKSCHTRQRFCLGCHSRMGVAPTSNKPAYGPVGRKKFHPKNWASTASRSRSRNRHAVHAKRSVGACVGCHRESTCVKCHGSRGVGGHGVSPHGRTFKRSSRCRVAVRRNKRVCLKCHRSTSAHLRCR